MNWFVKDSNERLLAQGTTPDRDFNTKRTELEAIFGPLRARYHLGYCVLQRFGTPMPLFDTLDYRGRFSAEKLVEETERGLAR